jgi:hypothetical protein
MPLIEQLKNDLKQARFNRDMASVTLLSTLLGESEMVGKNKNRMTTDEEFVAVVKKFLKNIDDTLKYHPTNESDLVAEKAQLENYLPKQLSKDDIILILKTANYQNLGDCMKDMKEKYAGSYDGKIVSEIFKSQNENF